MWEDAPPLCHETRQNRWRTVVEASSHHRRARHRCRCSATPVATVVIELPQHDVLTDESFSIVLSGLKPKASVTLRARNGAAANPWTSSATFAADLAGRVDLARMAPDAGSDTERGRRWRAGRWRVRTGLPVRYNRMMARSIAEQIEHEVSSWPDVTVSPHRFGGREFRVGRRELGHLHGDRLADLPFPVRVREQLVREGKAEPHHVLPQSGWVSRPIRGENDVDAVIALFRMNYDRAWSD